jgi:excisionase family DNA binding protein
MDKMLKEDNTVKNKWLNIGAVCDYTSLSPSTIRRAVYIGSLKASRITGRMLFKTSEVDRWLNG